ncbi:uncharacterized protein LOC116413333 [Galleria mellonella]|uniref:Uncharacterized protein LOC116413333 n=1 Tax=Galleria mellonella TaxID=7137 RepID=A0A6J3C7B9_GALME|nr:uncharacterized protein LOC116413333 [Galleria mellonella]
MKRITLLVLFVYMTMCTAEDSTWPGDGGSNGKDNCGDIDNDKHNGGNVDHYDHKDYNNGDGEHCDADNGENYNHYNNRVKRDDEDHHKKDGSVKCKGDESHSTEIVDLNLLNF